MVFPKSAEVDPGRTGLGEFASLGLFAAVLVSAYISKIPFLEWLCVRVMFFRSLSLEFRLFSEFFWQVDSTIWFTDYTGYPLIVRRECTLLY